MVWVLVGGEEDGVGLAGVDVDVVDGEGLDVVAVGFHHYQLVILQLTEKFAVNW